MENIRKKISRIALSFGMAVFMAQNVMGGGWPVFDVSGWLNGIDQLYQ